MVQSSWIQQIMGAKAYPDDSHEFVVAHNKKWEQENGMTIAEYQERKKAGRTNDPLKVIIQPAQLDLSTLGGGSNVEVKRFEFRPQEWGQFIGQGNAKAQAPIIKEFFKRGMPAHIILTGLQGHGKTSYIELLARDMDAHLISTIGSSVTLESTPQLLNEINASTKPCILFVDEFDTMESEIIKVWNICVEQFKINDRRINPFIFAGATINLDRITVKNPDFLDRIPFKMQFVRYSIDELKTIARQVQQQLFSETKISDEQLTRLANSCKLNPRTVIDLLKFLVVDGNVDNVLKVKGIVKDGLTLTDVKILEYLASSKKSVGANSIAMKCAMRQRQYEVTFEPYLFEEGYLIRTPQRMISDKGREFLASLAK